MKSVVNQVVACFFIVSKRPRANKYTIAKDLSVNRGTILVPVWHLKDDEETNAEIRKNFAAFYDKNDKKTSARLGITLEETNSLEVIKEQDFVKKMELKRVRIMMHAYTMYNNCRIY